MQFFCVKSTLPSAAVPWPEGSPVPVGLIVISWASSAAVGARPTPYVCASAALAKSRKIGTILSEPIGHASIAGDFPRHNGVVVHRRSELWRISHAQKLGDFLASRLDQPDLVGGARKNHVLVSSPVPHIAEPGVRHSLRGPLERGVVPRLPAVGGYLHLTNGAPAGPGQPCDLVPSAFGQFLPAGGERNDRLGSDLVDERSFNRRPSQMPKVVHVELILVDGFDVA